MKFYIVLVLIRISNQFILRPGESATKQKLHFPGKYALAPVHKDHFSFGTPINYDAKRMRPGSKVNTQ